MGSPSSDSTEVSRHVSTPGTQASHATHSPASMARLQSVRDQHATSNHSPSHRAAQRTSILNNTHGILSAQSSPLNTIPQMGVDEMFPQRPPSHMPHGAISTGLRLAEQGRTTSLTNVTSTRIHRVPSTPEPLHPVRQSTVPRQIIGLPTPVGRLMAGDTQQSPSLAVGLARGSTRSNDDNLSFESLFPRNISDGNTRYFDPAAILARNIFSTRLRFHPMSGIPGGHRHLHGQRTPLAVAIHNLSQGFSANYAGDTNLINNRSEDIPDSENCSLFMVNLPPNLTTHDLLGAIHKLGPSCRIYATHINPPEPGQHPGSAAKVVFLERDPAHEFFDKVCRRGGLAVNGHLARVTWNRIKTGEKPGLVHSEISRVLMIAGPPSFVNPRTLTAFFRSMLQFQIDRIITHLSGDAFGTDAVIEYRFGSFRCQAQAARMALQREMPHIRCQWAVDPLSREGWKPFEYFNFENGI